jgi:CRISPR-associated exonuclease Cas4
VTTPDEDDLVPLSALQHWLACPRQCALIHLEGVWDDNAYTAEGHVLHEAVDRQGSESRGGVRRVTGLLIQSRRLGLSGRADVVEFHPDPKGGPDIPYPVEHKRGRPKPGDWDRVQLCAQALCLEEMLGVPVPEGALFYAQTRRRDVVPFDAGLRAATLDAAQGVAAMMRSGRTPPPVAGPVCKGCSLRDQCLPDAGLGRSVEHWLNQRLAES